MDTAKLDLSGLEEKVAGMQRRVEHRFYDEAGLVVEIAGVRQQVENLRLDLVKVSSTVGPELLALNCWP